MAVAYDNSLFFASGNRDDSRTITLAANSILFAFLDLAAGGAAISAMSVGGASFVSIGGTDKLFAWVCSAPPTGITTIKVHNTGLFQHGVAFVSYTGHQQAGAYGTVRATSSGTASTFNISVSSTSTDLVINCIRATGGTNAAFANNGTTRLSGTNSQISRLIIADIGGASSITLSATVATAATSWDSISVPLHYTAIAATNACFLAMMGVGV